jgi:hypothetical protein
MTKKIVWLLVVGLFLVASCSVLPPDLFGGGQETAAPTCPALPTCPAQTTCEVCEVCEPCPTCEPTETQEPTLTSTPEITITPDITETLVVTETPTPTVEITETPTLTLEITETPTPTYTPTIPVVSDKPYQMQIGSPAYLPNFAHPAEGNNWLGVAGQVFDKSGLPVKYLVVVIEGYFNNEFIEEIALTSMAPAYGEGGYEIVLADQPVRTEKSLYISLYDLDGNQLSPMYPVNTSESTSENLILINFVAK